MKLSDRLKEAAKNPMDVILTRLGYVHADFDIRMEICGTCEFNIEEPLKDDAYLVGLLGLEDRSCESCGCPIMKACASKNKKCPEKKW